MLSQKAFSLIEILIAMVMMALVILAVTSVDITSRRFFGTSSDESWIQDEGKIAMQHIIKNVELGIGDMTDEGAMGSPPGNSTRGFYILNAAGNLATSGSRIQIKQDSQTGPNLNGRYDPGLDPFIEYEYIEEDLVNNLDDYIRFYPDATVVNRDDPNNFEILAEGIVQAAVFSFNNAMPDPTPNRVDVSLVVRREPDVARSLDNPQTTLTSNIILRAMSTR